MITKEEKLLILLKHQPYITEFDLAEYQEIYFEGSAWGKSVPYKPDGTGGLRRFTFIEYVDYVMTEDLDDVL
jgi:hypothetical protein